MIRLIHLDRSRSERIVWLLEELGLPYTLDAFQRRPDLYGPEEMRKAHVLGRAPVIYDGDVVLAESGAIVEYILARYGQGRLSVEPAAPNFARYLYWLHYAEGSLMLQLLREWSIDRMLPNADNHPGMARLREGTRTHLGIIKDALAGSAFLAGDGIHSGGHHNGVPVHDPSPSFPPARPRPLPGECSLCCATGKPARFSQSLGAGRLKRDRQ